MSAASRIPEIDPSLRATPQLFDVNSDRGLACPAVLVIRRARGSLLSRKLSLYQREPRGGLVGVFSCSKSPCTQQTISGAALADDMAVPKEAVGNVLSALKSVAEDLRLRGVRSSPVYGRCLKKPRGTPTMLGTLSFDVSRMRH